MGTCGLSPRTGFRSAHGAREPRETVEVRANRDSTSLHLFHRVEVRLSESIDREAADMRDRSSIGTIPRRDLIDLSLGDDGRDHPPNLQILSTSALVNWPS